MAGWKELLGQKTQNIQCFSMGLPPLGFLCDRGDRTGRWGPSSYSSGEVFRRPDS